MTNGSEQDVTAVATLYELL